MAALIGGDRVRTAMPVRMYVRTPSGYSSCSFSRRVQHACRHVVSCPFRTCEGVAEGPIRVVAERSLTT